MNGVAGMEALTAVPAIIGGALVVIGVAANAASRRLGGLILIAVGAAVIATVGVDGWPDPTVPPTAEQVDLAGTSGMLVKIPLMITDGSR